MTAYETMLSDSAQPDPEPGPSGSHGLPEAPPPPAGNGRRADSYRRLWQPPGRRRPAHRQALGQPYVWEGGEEPPEADQPGRSEPAGRSGAPLAAPALPAPANGTAPANEAIAVSNGHPSPSGRASILPAGPVRRDADLWPDRTERYDGDQWPSSAGRPRADEEYPGQPAARPERQYHRPRHGDLLGRAAALTERAVIGDLLRRPMAWCQEGDCIAWYDDPAALGEADVRARAMAAGWCMDAFGHLICPDCQQRYHVWSARPLVPRTGRQSGPDRRPVRQLGPAGQHRRQY